VKRAVNALEQVHARMLGAVLNMVAATRGKDGYGYSPSYTTHSDDGAGYGQFPGGYDEFDDLEQHVVLVPQLLPNPAAEKSSSARNDG
jgi:Mrp family chromosome partitioning ATPase